MIKRYMAAGLAALTLCGVCAPAYAADDEAAAQPIALSFASLEQTVRENNVSIKAYGNNLKSVEATDPGDSYIISYANVEDEISEYQRQIKELDQTINELDADETALRKTLQSQRASLQSSLNAALASYDDLEDQEDDDEDSHQSSINSTKRQTENLADQICMSAESTYISLQSLAYSRSQKERSIAQLDRDIAVTETRVSRGMASQNDLKKQQSERESLKADLGTIETQYENLKNTLAMQCGYSVGTALTTDALPEVTEEQLSAIDYDSDLTEALKNSYSIFEKEDAVRQASDDYENNVTDNLYTFKAAQIELDAEKESVTVSFRKLYKSLEEAQSLLTAAQADWTQAQKQFTIMKTKYDCGMISKNEYDDAQDEFTEAQETIDNAKIDLLTAYNTYQWAKRGVMSST